MPEQFGPYGLGVGRGLREDTADIRYVQIGALAGAEAAVPSALLRSRKLTISGSGPARFPPPRSGPTQRAQL
ncbi:MAG: hypothetical protein ACRDOD_18295, partial [Streptosporangiaceae bacterium]